MATQKIQIGDLVRDMTNEEILQWEKDQTDGQILVSTEIENLNIKIKAKTDVLDKLGLTADEAAALLG